MSAYGGSEWWSDAITFSVACGEESADFLQVELPETYEYFITEENPSISLPRFSSTHRVCTGVEAYTLYQNPEDIDENQNVLVPHPDFLEDEEIVGDQVVFTLNSNIEGDFTFYMKIENIYGTIATID